MNQSFADIALPVPIDHSFTYLIPPELQERIQRGIRVLVPFGKKVLTGVVVGLPASSTVSGLKPIRDVVDASPLLSGEMLELTKWISDYYFAPWGEVLKTALPQGLAQESKGIVMLVDSITELALEATKRSAKKQHEILCILQKHGNLTIAQIQKRTGTRSPHAALYEMEQKGWIQIEERISTPKASRQFETVVTLASGSGNLVGELSRKLSSKQKSIVDALNGYSEPVGAKALLKKTGASLSILQTLRKRGIIGLSKREVVRSVEYEDEPVSKITPNVHQRKALQVLEAALETGAYGTFLLHGVTGSGKTQVYIDAMKKALERGKTALVLVPEISLTPQTVRRFRAHFGSAVTVMHSQMSIGERYDAWRLAYEGKVKIAIGPRSAVFAPLNNLGLIVVDEEQESSYKQFDATPRYNARDVAIVRASHAKAVVILGSATPSIESYHNALSGKYRLLELPERVDNARLPKIEIVDMTKNRKRLYEKVKGDVKEKKTPFPKHLPRSSISQLLEEQIGERLRKKEGVILLQNRRGFSHVVECYDCGHVEKCDNCEVTLTYHITKKHLRCHYCGFVKKPPSVCPECGSVDIGFHSFGTQQVQEELQRLFPGAAILRMDLDTTSRKGAHDKLLQQFGKGEADILLGTQMVAKGLDFPRVTLVGVVSADTQMLLPDFRASERTFQLLTQVAGRAGRSNLAGEVVIQTLQPEHYSLNYVLSHDFTGFYNEELLYRKELDYPPFSRIVLIEFKGKNENEVYHHAKKFAEVLRSEQKNSIFSVLGPADAAIPKIKNHYRKLVVIKNYRDKDSGGGLLRAAIALAKTRYESSALRKAKEVTLTIDVDPQGMM